MTNKEKKVNIDYLSIINKLDKSKREVEHEILASGLDVKNELHYYQLALQFLEMGDKNSAIKCDEYYRACKKFNDRLRALKHELNRYTLLYSASLEQCGQVEIPDYIVSHYLACGAMQQSVIAFDIDAELKTSLIIELAKSENDKNRIAIVEFNKDDQRKIDKLLKNCDVEEAKQKIVGAYVATKIAEKLIETGKVSYINLGINEDKFKICKNACKMADIEPFKTALRTFPTFQNISLLNTYGVDIAFFINDINKNTQQEINNYITRNKKIPIKLFSANSNLTSYIDTNNNYVCKNKHYIDITNEILKGIDENYERSRDV